MTELVAFASGMAISAATILIGDKFLAWYFYHRMKNMEKEVRRLEEEITVLLQWRNK